MATTPPVLGTLSLAAEPGIGLLLVHVNGPVSVALKSFSVPSAGLNNAKFVPGKIAKPVAVKVVDGTVKVKFSVMLSAHTDKGITAMIPAASANLRFGILCPPDGLLAIRIALPTPQDDGPERLMSSTIATQSGAFEARRLGRSRHDA
jgi:hypothetical protein